MNCQEVQLLLLAADGYSSLPSTMKHHVRQCKKCRRLQARLKTLDRTIGNLPMPAGHPDAKAEFWVSFNRSFPRAVPPKARKLPIRFVILSAATAAALLIVFLIGFAAGRNTLRPAVVNQPNLSKSDKQPAAKRASNQTILFQLVQHDLKLAKSIQPEVQLDVLTEMSSDLRSEAVRLVNESEFENVKEVSALYARVVRDGLVGRTASMPPEFRKKVAPRLIKHLKQDQQSIEELSGELLPVVANMLEPMRSHAREAVQILNGEKLAFKLPQAPAISSNQTLATLVDGGLRLAGEADPLKRAEVCSNLTPVLAESIAMLSTNGETKLAAKMGEQLGELIDQGVKSNLQLKAVEAPEKNASETVERIRKTVDRTMTELGQSASQAHPEIKPSLEKALKAAESKGKWQYPAGPWKGKAGGKGKGKGKGKKNGGPPFIPPGLKKKLSMNHLFPRTIPVLYRIMHDEFNRLSIQRRRSHEA